MHSLRIILFIYAFMVLMALVGCGLADIPAQNRATEAENMRVYEIYQSSVRSMNEKRGESGIPPERIKSFEEWKKSPSTQ
jgi:hypothetical protein